jgi:aldose 1-epimerase
MAFRTSVETRPNGREVITLHDDASGSQASVLPSFGFNLFDLRLPVAGKITPILVSAPTFVDDPQGPARHGFPVLFPFPNRIKEGKYTWAGHDYQLPATNGKNAIHGWAMSSSWKVLGHGVDKDGAYVHGRYSLSEQSPDKHALWPTDGVLEIRYTLNGSKLSMAATVTNPTNKDLPYGLGFHPYFRIPFTPGGDTANTEVIIPAAKEWELVECLPTGKVKPVDARLDFQKGQPRKDLKLDDVLTGLSYTNGLCTCRLIDKAAKTEFRLSFDNNYREIVVFTPSAGPDVIAVEPYTQTTDAINLQQQGIDAGLRILKHGESHTLHIAMETAPI